MLTSVLSALCMLDPHSCTPYSIVGLTTVVYNSQEFRADGPYVEVANLARASEAVILLQVACATCSFQMRPGSSHTPSTLITLFLTSTQ
jgi:hypothetical protein